MLPDFPDFKTLNINDKNLLETITGRFEPYSDYNFTSLFCWDTEEKVKISSLNGNLIILFIDYLTNEEFYTFIGNQLIDETIDSLLDHAKLLKMVEKLKLVPEPVVKSIKDRHRYKIEEDRDSFDYILSVNDLVELKGRHYHPQRNFINRYKKVYESVSELKPLMLSDSNVKQEVLNLFYTWERGRGKSRTETQRELNAIKKLLEHSDLLDLRTLGLFINNELKGFTIYEILSDKNGIAHFEKVDISHVGIYQYLKHEVSEMFKKEGAEYMNIEQDLGVEGLRKTKLASHPVKFLKKYTISLAD